MKKWKEKCSALLKPAGNCRGTAISSEVVMGIATVTGVVISHDANLLAENGVHIEGLG